MWGNWLIMPNISYNNYPTLYRLISGGIPLLKALRVPLRYQLFYREAEVYKQFCVLVWSATLQCNYWQICHPSRCRYGQATCLQSGTQNTVTTILVLFRPIHIDWYTIYSTCWNNCTRQFTSINIRTHYTSDIAKEG